jgi:hypothetical protein
VIQTVFQRLHLGELADVLNDLFGSEAHLDVVVLGAAS